MYRNGITLLKRAKNKVMAERTTRDAAESQRGKDFSAQDQPGGQNARGNPEKKRHGFSLDRSCSFACTTRTPIARLPGSRANRERQEHMDVRPERGV
jgi:hypothetical protein